MINNFKSESAQQTKKFARQIAQYFVQQGPGSQATVLALKGELGSGKTTFVQGFAKDLGVDEKILSPTFVVLKKFSLDRKFETLYHIDCYRIEQPQEILDLNFKKIVRDPQNLLVIEWADKIKTILPDCYWKLSFEVKGKQQRSIKINQIKK